MVVAASSLPRQRFLPQTQRLLLPHQRFVASSFLAPNRSDLHQRIVVLGESCSLEIAPDYVSSASPAPHSSCLHRLSPLAPGSRVFVNMVKTNLGHFDDVISASRRLVAEGIVTVPHVPASRFDNVNDFRCVIDKFMAVGVKDFLIIGGNDLVERSKSGSAFLNSGALLEAEVGFLKSRGVRTVSLAGHPDAWHGCVQEPAASSSIVLTKARLLLNAGIDVSVVSQFCFDAQRLGNWLGSTRSALRELATEADGLTGCMQQSRPRRTAVYIGVPGPTPWRRMHRISTICKVPLEGAAVATGSSNGVGAPGPSVFVGDGDGATKAETPQQSEMFLPDMLVSAVAAHCEHAPPRTNEDVGLHFFPFGGVDRTLEYVSSLRSGEWPCNLSAL
eukprot:TRINITY_DN59220_c0_g1_i1.p1 TRINITY_DN59220_c0_g1~~TRINITY_DN59220_c0_g1_i1.p1  ORF type:complete len:389 (-),score=46.39 TRINITY_DN59220_c0_g1_i1:65-1231(-)